MDGGSGVYVLARINDEHSCYACHGEKAGVPDAIGYTDKCHARKFLSEEDARIFGETQLPAWGRARHCVLELSAWDLAIGCPKLAAYRDTHRLAQVPEEYLETPADHLLVWRC